VSPLAGASFYRMESRSSQAGSCFGRSEGTGGPPCLAVKKPLQSTAVQRNKGGTTVEKLKNDPRVIQWPAYGLRSKKNTCP
jgi:hypothetical protein